MNNEQHAGDQPLAFAPVAAKILRLQAARHERDKQQLFFVEGVRNFVAAVDNSLTIETLVYSEKLLIAPLARKMVRRLKRAGVPFARVTPEQFRTVSQTERASGIAAIVRQPQQTLEQINPRRHFCWMVLSQLRSNGNFGTLLRTSAAVGAGGFILLDGMIDPFDPHVVRASMGAIFRQTIVRASRQGFRQWIEAHQLAVIGASPHGTLDYDRVRYTAPTILWLGEERAGLTPEEQMICRQLVRIPMREGTDSLNVAVAGSLLLYEIYRSAKRGK